MHLSRFLRDANSFVASSGEAIEKSAPHIYLSALPFAAKRSLIYTSFSSLITGAVSVETLGIDHHDQRLAMVLRGNTWSVSSVAYTRDGRLVSGSDSGTVRIWDTRTGEASISLLCGTDPTVTCVAVSQTGNALAAGTAQGSVYLWNLQDLHSPPLRLLAPGFGPFLATYAIAISPNGRLIIAGFHVQILILWSVTTGQRIATLSGHKSVVCTVAFSPDGETIASGSADGTLRLWIRMKDERPTKWRGLSPGGAVNSVCFSPDGKRLATGLDNGVVQLWDVMNESNTETLHGHTFGINSVEFSPDGSSLMSASDDHTVRIWKLGQSVVLLGHSSSVKSAAFSPDGLYIASAFGDHTIRIWDASTDQQEARPLEAHQHPVRSVAVSDNGAFIATHCCKGKVRVWDAQTGNLRHPPDAYEFTAVAISQDACLAASEPSLGKLQLWDLNTGDRVGEPLQHHQGKAEIVVFSPDRRWVACKLDYDTIHIWNVSTQQPLKNSPLVCQKRPSVSDESSYYSICRIAFSPDGQLVAAGDDDGNIHLWNMLTGEQLNAPHRVTRYMEIELCFAFSPDSLHIASSSANSTAKVWNIASRRTIFLLGDSENDEWSEAIAYLPGGKIIVTGLTGHSIRLWDAEAGVQLAALHGHYFTVNSIAWTSDNRSIVTGSADCTLRVWDLETALARTQAIITNPMTAFERDGLHNGWALGQAGELLLWVPKEYRAHLNVPSCKFLIATHRVTITTGDVWHHGENWTACWLGALSA